MLKYISKISLFLLLFSSTAYGQINQQRLQNMGQQTGSNTRSQSQNTDDEETEEKEAKEAREKIISGNLRLVLSVIQRFGGRGENADDVALKKQKKCRMQGIVLNDCDVVVAMDRSAGGLYIPVDFNAKGEMKGSLIRLNQLEKLKEKAFEEFKKELEDFFQYTVRSEKNIRNLLRVITFFMDGNLNEFDFKKGISRFFRKKQP